MCSAVVFTLLFISTEYPEPHASRPYYHTIEELQKMLGNTGAETPLPLGTDENFFRGAGLCEGCHGLDPNGIASLDAEGNDINPTDQWRATMMANSAKDPFWRAKVSHEVSVNPEHQTELEDKCTSCHAPMGHYGARFDHGATHYSMSELLTDSLGLDGVSCNACHAQSDLHIGNIFSGNMNFSPDTIYGPYGDEDDPVLFSQPMTQFVGFEPVYGEHSEKSEMCASCHTLITETVDLEGNYTGGTFVEQSTYHEWLNSVYASEGVENKECQTCHFPRIDDEVIISSNYAFLDGRSPYGQHFMVGGNTFMLELMKNRINELGLSATESDFDKVIQRTMDALTQESLTLEIEELGADNDTLFHSGRVMNDYEVQGQNETYEPHYLEINAEDQVQIYEMVMGDVNDDVTTVLERADHYIKDNRLVPLGFSSSHEVYDTTIVAGTALLDTNFNLDNSSEGTGADKIIYKAPMDGFEGNVDVTARVWYQSVPPKWNEEMFAFETPEITSFRTMYDEEGADPVMVDEVMTSTFVQSTSELESAADLAVYPSIISVGEELTISSSVAMENISIYSVSGKLVYEENSLNDFLVRISTRLSRGTYLIAVSNSKGIIGVEKVVFD